MIAHPSPLPNPGFHVCRSLLASFEEALLFEARNHGRGLVLPHWENRHLGIADIQTTRVQLGLAGGVGRTGNVHDLTRPVHLHLQPSGFLVLASLEQIP